MQKTTLTSFTKEGYAQYGKNFLQTYRKYWPCDVKCVVYYEGDKFPEKDDERVKWKKIFGVHRLKEYLQQVCCFPLMTGQTTQGYNINYDARMARKAFMQVHAMREFAGKVFWLDADIHTFAKIPDDFLDTVLPDRQFCCFLGRDKGESPIKYTESGFLGFNAEHPFADKFANVYLNIFLTGLIFTQKGWHDCYAFDLARKYFDKPLLFNNLGEDVNVTGTAHVFINSCLGKYMDHRKGNRKSDKSRPKDLAAPRTEAYWNAGA